MTRRLAPALVFAMLSACAGASEPVATEAQAIRVAKERCSLTRPFEATERWHAKLHDGRWHVWLVRDIDPREPVVGTLDVWVGAKDGAAGDCNHV